MVLRSFHIWVVILLILIAAPVNGGQENIQGIIDSLDEQIASSASADEKATLCCYRARNYVKLKDIDQAEQDYLEALEHAYSGWILHEYSYFLYRTGEYERAYRASLKVLEDFPQFEKSATKLKRMAFTKSQEEYNSVNPPTIIMNTEVDPHRVTRHDLIRKLGPQKEATIFKTDLNRSSSSRSSSTKTRKSSTTKRS